MSAPAKFRRAPPSVVFVDQPRLFRFVVLSMLLHLWIVVLFGTSTYSGARRDHDFGGAFDVSLRALIEDRGSGFRLAPGADTVAPGTALLPHAGSTAPPQRRETARPPDASAPPAPEAAPQPVTEAPRPTIVAPPPETAAPPPAVAAPPIAPPAAEPLPRLNLDAPDQIDKPYAPAAPPPPIEREAAPPAPTPPREIPPPPAPIERVVPPQIERDAAPPVDAKPREVPVPAPAETKPRDVAPSPIEPPVPPIIEREIAPAPEAKPRVVPIAPAAAPERMPAPRIDTEPAPPVARRRHALRRRTRRAPRAVAPSVQRDVALARCACCRTARHRAARCAERDRAASRRARRA